MIEPSDESEYALVLALESFSSCFLSSNRTGRSLDKIYCVMVVTLTGSLTVN